MRHCCATSWKCYSIALGVVLLHLLGAIYSCWLAGRNKDRTPDRCRVVYRIDTHWNTEIRFQLAFMPETNRQVSSNFLLNADTFYFLRPLLLCILHISSFYRYISNPFPYLYQVPSMVILPFWSICKSLPLRSRKSDISFVINSLPQIIFVSSSSMTVVNNSLFARTKSHPIIFHLSK